MSYGRFGVREICDVVFRPLASMDIGNQHFDRMQPCLYLDTAQTSSLEGAATTVYAQGGKGNPRLIAWEGEKTLTLTITDALMSTISFAMLSGAGVVETYEDGENDHKERAVYMHTTYEVPVQAVSEGEGEEAKTVYYAEVDAETRNGDQIFVSKEAPVYGVVLNDAGGIKTYLSAIKLAEISYGENYDNASEATEMEVGSAEDSVFFKLASESNYQGETHAPVLEPGDVVRIDCYTIHKTGATQINIDAENFAGYYYIEADTLFRDEATGKDFPAEFVIPRGKIQSNFTFSMASSGDPSTFDFTIDCFPAYTAFSRSKKVLAQLNIVDPTTDLHNYKTDVHGHADRTGDSDIVDEAWFGKSIFEA